MNEGRIFKLFNYFYDLTLNTNNKHQNNNERKSNSPI